MDKTMSRSGSWRRRGASAPVSGWWSRHAPR